MRKKRLHFRSGVPELNLFHSIRIAERDAGRGLLARRPDYKANKKAIHAQLGGRRRTEWALSEQAGHCHISCPAAAAARPLPGHGPAPDILCFDEPTSALDPELTGCCAFCGTLPTARPP